MENQKKNKCVYCGDPNCDLKCKPISQLNEYLIFAICIISFGTLLYFCFI